jgi:hypothetical protein
MLRLIPCHLQEGQYNGTYNTGMPLHCRALWSSTIQLYILIIKPTRCTNFSNLFLNDILHVSDSSSVHRQELFTVHSAMIYVIQVFRQLSSRIRMDTTAVRTAKNSWWWTEELSEKCRVSFKNKFEKSVHLVGFIIRICHDAWSQECKKKSKTLTYTHVSCLVCASMISQNT